MVRYTDKHNKLDISCLHNVYCVKSVKKSIYSSLTRWLTYLFRYLKVYTINKHKTSFFEILSNCFCVLLMFTFFYFLSIFLCAIDDQCASFYMGGV